jgi:hypothetical protein
MHGEVEAAVQQAVLDLLGEQALAADLGQRPVLHLVAGGADDDDLDRAGHGQGRMGVGQAPPRLLGLDEGERAAARPDAKNRGHDPRSRSPGRGGQAARPGCGDVAIRRR